MDTLWILPELHSEDDMFVARLSADSTEGMVQISGINQLGHHWLKFQVS